MRPGSRAHEQGGLKRRRWSREEDQKLIEHKKRRPKSGGWANVPKDAGLMSRSGKSCRLRWINYLRPGIKNGNFTPKENNTIIGLQSHLGNRWSLIAARLPGRTEIQIKNHWNTRLKKNLARKKDIPTATQTTLSQKSLAAADLLDSTGNYRNGNALKFPDEQPTNLHLLHNPVLQGFGYVTPNPQAQLHGLTRFNSIGPVQALPTTLPPQGSSFNYQAMERPVPQPRNNHGADFINMPTDPAQTLPTLPSQGLLTFTYPAMEEPTVNNNYTDQFRPSITDVGYGNVPNRSSIPPLMVSAISMTNQVENDITLPAEEISNPFSTSTICEAWPQWVMPGHNMPTDPAQTLPSLPSQGLSSFTYQAMEEPTINNYTDQFGPWNTNITNSPVCGDLSLEHFSIVHPNTTLM